ncbi:MAG: caspase family protein [Gemmatimonadetes bacterium]|nr:caspase family protein [Gemmatimonadota bacterium]
MTRTSPLARTRAPFITRPRLVALAALLLAVGSPAAGQSRARSLDDVVRLLRSGVTVDRMLDQLRLDCIDFGLVGATRTRLRDAGASPETIQALSGICFAGGSIAVETDGDSALVMVDADTVGTAPTRVRVSPLQPVRVSVLRGTTVREVAVTPRAGVEVVVKVALPGDTTAWPPVRSDREIVQQLGLSARYPILPDTLDSPPLPTNGSGLWRFVLGSALVGGAGFAASSAVCGQSVTAPSSGGYLSNGTPVAPGASVSLGASSGCQIGIAAGGALAGGLLNLWWGSRSDDESHREYARARAAYPARLAAARAARLAQQQAIETDSAVQAARSSDATALARVQQRNRQVLASNERLPAPQLRSVVIDRALAGAVAAAAPGLAAPPTAPAPSASVDDALSSDVDVNIPQGTVLRDKAVAVVIGNRGYSKRDVPPVDFAVNDARTMREYLVRTFGFRPDNVIFEENASLSTFTRIFGDKGNEKGQLYNYLAPDSASDVFVFYSGHGAPDPTSARAYLVPVDADPQLLQLTGYSLDVLYQNLGKLPLKSVTVMLDACFSGTSDRGSLFKGISPALLRVEAPLLQAPNAGVLAASAANQVSGWYEEKKHGLFSYFLFKGLRGAADRNGDGRITLQELADFTTTSIVPLSRRLKNREQTPELTSNAPERPLIGGSAP